MRVLIATDAWHPQVNGVVRTLTSLARSRAQPGRHRRVPVAGGISLRSPADLSGPAPGPAEPPRDRAAHRASEPDAIHIATEGPIGLMVRAYCLQARTCRSPPATRRGFPNTSRRASPIPESWSYAALRRFHAAAAVTMVSTPSLMAELTQRGFKNLGMWTRGVDTDLFRPERAIDLDLPRPIFVSVGRVAVEKNLEAFLSLDLPGSKVVIGHGPQEAELRRRFPDAKFLGLLEDADLGRSSRRRRTCSCFRAGPTRSASCSSKRWLAACRSRPIRSPVRRTWSADNPIGVLARRSARSLPGRASQSRARLAARSR